MTSLMDHPWIAGVDTSWLDKPLSPPPEESLMRTFETGATRDSDEEKWDYEGFLSPLVIRRYAEYLHKHRTQADGKMRDSDNWQKGIPIATYMKSMWRHFVDLWTLHRTKETFATATKEEALCAVIFNASGYLHEILKGSSEREKAEEFISNHVDRVIAKRGSSIP